MHREGILINLNWQGKLQTECGPGFTTEMGVEHLEFIMSREEGGIVWENSEFMATRCFESNCIFSMAHPRM
jgi:hypothetical protein